LIYETESFDQRLGNCSLGLL